MKYITSIIAALVVLSGLTFVASADSEDYGFVILCEGPGGSYDFESGERVQAEPVCE